MPKSGSIRNSTLMKLVAAELPLTFNLVKIELPSPHSSPLMPSLWASQLCPSILPWRTGLQEGSLLSAEFWAAKIPGSHGACCPLHHNLEIVLGLAPRAPWMKTAFWTPHQFLSVSLSLILLFWESSPSMMQEGGFLGQGSSDTRATHKASTESHMSPLSSSSSDQCWSVWVTESIHFNGKSVGEALRNFKR